VLWKEEVKRTVITQTDKGIDFGEWHVAAYRYLERCNRHITIPVSKAWVFQAIRQAEHARQGEEGKHGPEKKEADVPGPSGYAPMHHPKGCMSLLGQRRGGHTR